MGIGMRPRHGRRNLQTDRVNCVGEAIGVTGFAMGLGRLLKHVDELIVVKHSVCRELHDKCSESRQQSKEQSISRDFLTGIHPPAPLFIKRSITAWATCLLYTSDA